MQSLIETSRFSSVIDVVQHRADVSSEAAGFIYLDDQLEKKESINFVELDHRARALAAVFQQTIPAGERVILIFPPGVEFIVGFVACLYAGVLAVPVYPPQSPKEFTRLLATIKNATASTVCTVTELKMMVSMWLSSNAECKGTQVIATSEATPEMASLWRKPNLNKNSLAFLQYTSGSTGDPKGVMVSHGNLLNNFELIGNCFQVNEQTISTTWLPPYHDMGLIGTILQPIYKGCTTVAISPLTFLKRPLSWLEIISRYRVTCSGGPNFAYELVTQKADAEFVAGLDLSSWQVAFNGAEAMRANTLNRFAETFAPAGFKPSVFLPCYGLAEATLIVSGCPLEKPPVMLGVVQESLATRKPEFVSNAARGQTLVGCGKVLGGEILIVDPETKIICDADEIGEIWLNNGSVAQGYWQNDELTREIFQAKTSCSNKGPYLRTGDLGFLHQGELFISGRLKEVVIIGGRNIYPVDIEDSVQLISAVLRAGCGAAFAVDSGDGEQLVVVQEVRKEGANKLNAAETLVSIRNKVVANHAVRPFDIVLIRHGSLSKTTSGKIQRNATKQQYIAGTLDIIASLKGLSAVELSSAQAAAKPIEKNTLNVETIVKIVRKKLALVTGVAAENLDLDMPFSDFGMDSKQAVGMVGELEAEIGCELPGDALFRYPSIRSLVNSIVDDPRKDNSVLLKNNADAKRDSNEPIAIIGMACKFPGISNSVHEFWNLINQSVNAVTEIPSERWDVEKYYDERPVQAGKMATRWGGFIEQPAHFDAGFFGISPREAELMDPQQRLLLETSWHAFEEANINVQQLAGSETGVFVGIASNDYARLQNGLPCSVEAWSGTGNALSIAANRLSYFYDFQGPSVAVDTACSSSLVAVHFACESLRNGDSDLAVAAGINLLLAPDLNILFSQARMMSPQGNCKSFDDSADGYVRGEGCGVVLLKPLSKALADGNKIHALINGSAINQDGRSNGITAPNGLAQEKVIQKALKKAGITPAQVGYVEAHGTGTPLGDSIEATAILNSYCDQPRNAPLAIGSAKSQIGHLEAAAGIAGLIRASLALKNKILPPTLHLNKLNSKIAWGENRAEVVPYPKIWPENQDRFAAVSSFGFGGSNAHVILQAFPASALDEEKSSSAELVTLSAHSVSALRVLAKKHLENLANVAYLSSYAAAMNIGRAQLRFRAACVVNSLQDVRQFLSKVASGDEYYDSRHSVDVGLQKHTADSSSNRHVQMFSLMNQFLSGWQVDLAPVANGIATNHIELPAYPFERQRYWCLPENLGQIEFKKEMTINTAGEKNSILQFLRVRISTELGFEVNELDTTLPLIDLGMDSVSAMEILADIEQIYAAEISMMRLLEGVNTNELALMIEDCKRVSVPPLNAKNNASNEDEVQAEELKGVHLSIKN